MDNDINKSSFFKLKIIFLLISIIVIITIFIIIIVFTLAKKSDPRITDEIYINPSHIDGIAGNNYSINLQFPNEYACSNDINFSFNNSYNLSDNNFIIEVEELKKECQFIFHIIQYKMTNDNLDNILTIYYNNKIIRQKISLKIGNADLHHLELISGPTEGNVLDPPIIVFKPFDKYGNLYTNIFDNINMKRRNLQNDFLDTLTNAVLSTNTKLEISNSIDEKNKNIKVQYKSKKSGNVVLTSPYFHEKILYRIKSGPIDLNNSFIQVISENIYIGSTLRYIIHLKDLYGNDIDDLNENDYHSILNNQYFSANNKCNLKNNGLNRELSFNVFQCEEIISKDNYYNINEYLNSNLIKCINCNINLTQEEEEEEEAKCKDNTKPFWCLINGEYNCTKSQTDCDCPKGYIKCKIQNYCVPGDRYDMCATFKILNNYCKIYYGTSYKMFDDGYCRLKDYRIPNQRVCPKGKVLCADLSCRDSYDECIISEERGETDIRCVGQQLVTNIKDCPSTITCENETDVVCPDGSCVENEIYCADVTKCEDEKKPYLCQNNQCAEDFDSCSPGITCGHKDSLCVDKSCKEKC